MHTPRDRVRMLAVLSLVIALHAIVGWLLVMTTRLRPVGGTARGFEIVFIAPPPADSRVAALPLVTPRGRGTPPRRERSPGGLGTSAPGTAAGLEPSSSLERHDAPPRNAPAASGHPSIDWEEELTRAAKDAGSGPTSPPPKDFGFPHAAASPPTRTEQFAWDYAHTHRVESIPGGGILVNLNDNCVLVFNPLPLVFCQPGKKPANGQLFEHMHDATASGASDGNP